MNTFCIGSDILDMGSRRAEARAKRLRGFEAELNNNPTHFEVPNVSDVRFCCCCCAPFVLLLFLVILFL